MSVASIGHLSRRSSSTTCTTGSALRPMDLLRPVQVGQRAIRRRAAQRWADDGIAVNAVMPGNVASTGLARHMGADDLAAFGERTELGLPPEKTVEQGAATSVLVAASPDVEGVTGRYYEDCAQAATITERAGHTGGVAPYALDADNAERLWSVSSQLTQ